MLANFARQYELMYQKGTSDLEAPRMPDIGNYCGPSRIRVLMSCGPIWRKKPDSHILDTDYNEGSIDEFKYCSYYGTRNPCDIKVKTNRFQIFGLPR